MKKTRRPQPRTRGAGVLLHVSSLPGRHGIGDLGPAALAWVDALANAGQTWWQILPLGPAGAGDSPYQCFSAFAGNPNLISPDALVEDSFITPAELSAAAGGKFPPGQVDFPRVTRFKDRLLRAAFKRFEGDGRNPLRRPFERFRAAESHWLDDFALFMAIKEGNGGAAMADWPAPLRLRRPTALAEAARDLAPLVSRHQFIQFLFFRQLGALRAHARGRGVRLVGDLPIFVSPESADVWANPHLFLLDKDRRPKVVAGVPPDYFSATGQRWGNPLYDWRAMKRDGYAWWVARLSATLQQVDVVRVDHFRGFASYWEIPARAKTAKNGRWVKGPGMALFDVFKDELGDLPLIAEDLGTVTPDVEQLRQATGLPGMRVLQFAFGGGPQSPFLPHAYVRNTVVYTGTHDNDTTAGWFASLGEEEADRVRGYLPGAGGQRRAAKEAAAVAWELTRMAWASVADYAIVPMQDVLGMGTAARMNFPGRAEGNWRWRLREGEADEKAWGRLAELTELYDRRGRADLEQT